MSRRERVERGSDIARQELRDARRRARRLRRRHRGTFRRVLRAGLLMALVAFVVVPAMIAGGFLFGPRGVEGLVTAPLVLFSSWAAILYFTFGRRPPARIIANADLAKLPERTEEWLEFQRRSLPSGAQSSLDSLTGQLESLAPQLEGLDPQQPAAVELRRLLAEELPDLVNGYRKVPRQLQGQPSLGGSSPERQLLEGLATIDQQLGRIQERLAAEDVRALATHKRYLELKYKGDDELK